MKQLHLVLFALLFSSSLHAQTFSELLEKGKQSVKTARDSYAKSDGFAEGTDYLERAVKLNPNSQEAHYFLGSAYDYTNNSDASQIIYTHLPLTIKASKEFEKVIAISRTYKGDIIALDPYAKISSIWSCQALCYLYHHQHDSARWAFREGKKRGGFSDFCLAYHREIFSHMAPNSIIFTYGDNSTMCKWYLQEMENLSPDVTVINTEMLQLPWYAQYIGSNAPAIYSSPAIATDTAEYSEWKETTIQVPIRNTGDYFSWTVKPTQNDAYILRSDKIIIDIVQHNAFNNKIYFEKGLRGQMLGLDKYVADRFSYEELQPTEAEIGQDFYDAIDAFPFAILKDVNSNSNEDLFYVHNLRYGLISAIYHRSQDDQPAAAKALYQKMLREIPPKKYPYETKDVQDYVDKLAETLK